MQLFVRRLYAALTFFLVAFPVSAFASSDFKHIAIARCGDGLFCGAGKQVHIEFTADQSRPNPDQFPEPPLTIRRNDGSVRCSVAEGGIWVRASVYLREDEEVLLVEEYSGAGTDLVQYATDDCCEVRRIDVSDRVWALNEGILLIGEQCRSKTISSCKVKQQRELTLRRE